VDDQDEDVPPRQALEEAREAVTRVLAEEYLEAEGIDDLDGVTEWYILCWLVYGKQTFSYDEGHQLGLGVGIDVDDIKRNTKIWRRSSGDIKLRGYSDRVQNINEKPENRSSRTPVNPDDLSFGLALDKVHAAMHVYDVQGESACCDWLRERNFDSDSTFKSTLKALLQVLPTTTRIGNSPVILRPVGHATYLILISVRTSSPRIANKPNRKVSTTTE